MRRLVHGLAAVAFAGLMLAGCNKQGGEKAETAGGKTASGEKLTVGFSQIGAENPWRTAETNSIREEAENRGIDLKFSDAQGKQEGQVSAIKNYIAQKVDAIILAPKVETGWEQVLTQAKNAKIPVILVDRGVTVSDQSLYTTLIASDFVEEGRRAGEWLAEKTSGTAKIVELQGTAGAAPANDRHKGFAEAIAKHPGMQIVRSQSGDFNRSKGKEVMEAFLKADPSITAVYSHNDDMALGAIQAIEEAGKKPGTDILIVSVDGMKEMIQAIADGKANCTVECNPLLGPAAFDAVKDAVDGKTLEKKIIAKDALFDESNAKQVLPERKY
jgi:simple sugar transport system substrate-binding protein